MLAYALALALANDSATIDRARLAAFADSALPEEMRRAGAPGAVLVVVQDGAVVLQRGYGAADVDRRRAMDPERTVLRVGSVSKLFVATAVIQLEERGKVELDADVSQYLRGLRITDDASRPITLHQLLTHTAGFDERNIGYAARSAGEVIPLGEYLARRMPPRTLPPGTVTSYSNHGAALAGYVVESVTRVPFSAYVRREILEPLGMRSSGFEQPPSAELREEVVTPYPCGADPEARAGCPVRPLDFRHTHPAGSLLATGADMGRFMIAQLGGGDGGSARPPLFGDSARRAMQARHFTHHPLLPGMAYGFYEQRINGERALSHGGGLPGANTLLMLLPDRRLGLFLHTNGGATTLGAAVVRAFADRFVGARVDSGAMATESADVAFANDGRRRLAGVYRSTRYARRSIEKLPALFASPVYVERDTGASGAALLVTGLGGGAVRYLPVGSLVYRQEGGDKRLAFRTDASGRVTHLFGGQSFFGSEFPGAFERLAWYDAPSFMNELLSWAFTLPLLVLVVIWPATVGAQALLRRAKRRPPPAPLAASRRRRQRWAIGAAAAFAVATIAFGFGFLARSVRLLETAELLYGLPAGMKALAWMPFLIVALAVVLCVLSVRAWRKRYWGLAGRLYFVAIALDAVVMVAVLVRWSYLPASY
jgi:CubicO group peptidase (beta-lactamase class C family)